MEHLITIGMEETPIKLHPAVQAIRNKRQRLRLVKKYARKGITVFYRPVQTKTPINP